MSLLNILLLKHRVYGALTFVEIFLSQVVVVLSAIKEPPSDEMKGGKEKLMKTQH